MTSAVYTVHYIACITVAPANLKKKSKKDMQKKMHWPGIEPGPPAWQARILPLNHQCSVDEPSMSEVRVKYDISCIYNAL